MKNLIGIAFFLIAAAQVAQAELKLPVPELETLPNGLQLVWFLDDSLPVIDLAVLVKSGFRDDPAGKSGTTDLASAVLDRGNAGMNAQQIAHSIEALGASRYSSADEDTFSVGLHGLAPDAPVLLETLSKIVLHPDFPESEVNREHDRMLDRWAHIADSGETLVSLAYRRIITAGTAYGRGSFTSAAEFGKVGRADVVDYYHRNFTPKNAILMVVGRVKREEFKKKIEELFGSWQGEAPTHDYRKYTDKRLFSGLASKSRGIESGVTLVGRSDLTQAQVRMGFVAPSIHAPEHYALAVANALTGEYFDSRLNSLIRDKLGLTYGISSGFGYGKDFSDFSISSSTKNESVGQLIKKTLEVLKDLKKGPIPEAEVRTAKDYLIGGFPLSTSTLGSVAARWLAGDIFDLGTGYLNEFIPKVEAVTAQEVLQAVQKDFDLQHLTIVVAGDPVEIEKSLKEAKVGPIRKVSVKDLR